MGRREGEEVGLAREGWWLPASGRDPSPNGREEEEEGFGSFPRASTRELAPVPRGRGWWWVPPL